MTCLRLVAILAGASHVATASPRTFGAAGIIIGGTNATTYSAADLGGEIEGGYRLTKLWFLHGELAYGRGAMIDEPSSTLLQTRAGVETRSCGSGTCLVFGLDLGFEHDTDGNMSLDTARVIPRVGLDVGDDRFRFRPSIEAALSRGTFVANDGTIAVLVTLAMAYEN